MKDRLKRLLSETERSDAMTSVALDAETLAQLESLGYLGDDIVVDYSFEEGEEDAKDMISVVSRINVARHMARTGQTGPAIESCTAIIEEHPNVTTTYGVLADIYYGLKEYDKTLVVLERKLTLFPDDRTGLVRLFAVYHDQKEYSKAVETLLKIIALKPDDAMAYKSLLNVLYRQKSFEKIIDAVQRRRAVLPDDAQTLITLGKTYQGLNDPTNALTCFVEAATVNPKSGIARVNAAATYLDMGNLGQALFYYEQALALDDNNPAVHSTVAWIKAVDINSPDYDPATALLNARTTLQGNIDTRTGKCEVPVILDALSSALAANGKLEAAIAAAERARELYAMRGLAAQSDRMNWLIEAYKKKKVKHP